MKKFYLLISMLFALSGCIPAMQDDEFSTLKIKVLNLETQAQVSEKRISEIEARMDNLEKRLTQEISQRFLDAQAKMLSDIEETKRDLSSLQARFEESQFQKEADSKVQRKNLEDLLTRLETLELKIKEIEKKQTEILSSNRTQPMPVSNQTQNATLESSPQKTPPPQDNKTASQQKPAKEEDLYQQAYALYEKEDLKGARNLWNEYLKRFPKGKWVGQTHFYIGETYFKEKEFEQAILEYQKLIEMPGANPLKPKAMLRQAEAFIALKDKKAAEILYKKVIQLYPGTKEAKEAKEKLAKLK